MTTTYYSVRCTFTDESVSKYEGLTYLDLCTVVETFDNLSITSALIEVES